MMRLQGLCLFLLEQRLATLKINPGTTPPVIVGSSGQERLCLLPPLAIGRELTQRDLFGKQLAVASTPEALLLSVRQGLASGPTISYLMRRGFMPLFIGNPPTVLDTTESSTLTSIADFIRQAGRTEQLIYIPEINLYALGDITEYSNRTVTYAFLSQTSVGIISLKELYEFENYGWAVAFSSFGTRKTYEDRFICQELAPGVRLVAVADGVGNRPDGDLAAEITIETLSQHLQSLPAGTIINETVIEAGIQKAHQAIRDIIAKYPEKEGMSTTIVAAVIADQADSSDKDVFLCHVGDSRAYLFNPAAEDPTTLHTIDHTHQIARIIARLFPGKKRSLTGTELQAVEETMEHRSSGRITTAVGMKIEAEIEDDEIPPLPVTTSHFSLLFGSSLLFCSDGLWDVFLRREDDLYAFITEQRRQGKSEEEVARELLLYSHTSSRDNITGVLVG